MSDSDDDNSKSGGGGNIVVFGRIRPPTKRNHVNPDLYEIRGNKLILGRGGGHYDDGDYGPDNAIQSYKFKFNHLFDQTTTQEQIFTKLAYPILQSFLAGFNATIFAYGQTGSGKTYTITGGPERYEDRGLIPRTLSALFSEMESNSEFSYRVRISYLEIYQGVGYDLLDPNHETKNLQDLPRVTMTSDSDGNVVLKNIGELPVNSVEDALNLLFVGDTNRIICTTPSNDSSTRSHCIFTINLEARQVGGTKIRRSKLHLVDLAGSERVKNTEVEGKLFTEAVSINLSLMYLKQVIVALHQASKGYKSDFHIPYRNSLMTSVLRDSLGGNCKTAMIATLSIEERHVPESISTAKFAQEVALIKNRATLNEEEDPKMIIQKLKTRVRELQEQLAAARGEQVDQTRPLTDDERLACRGMVQDFLSSNKPIEVVLPSKISFCYRLMKEKIERGEGNKEKKHSDNDEDGEGEASGLDAHVLRDEVKKLRMMVQTRDNEISVLVGMLKENPTPSLKSTLSQRQQQQLQQPQMPPQRAPPTLAAIAQRVEQEGGRIQLPSKQANRSKTLKVDETTMASLVDRSAAFEDFRAQYSKNAVMSENKEALRSRYGKAKALGEAVNHTKLSINRLKSEIEQRRVQRGIQALSDGDASGELDPEEARLTAEIERGQREYRENYLALKKMKGEIDHLQMLLQKNRRQMQQEFELWWERHQHAYVTDARNDLPLDLQSPKLVKRPQPQQPSNVPSVTGNAQADADIAAFYRMRDSLRKN